MLGYCWPSAVHRGPALGQHWVNIYSLVSSDVYTDPWGGWTYCCVIKISKALAQHIKRWPNAVPASEDGINSRRLSLEFPAKISSENHCCRLTISCILFIH